jgi:amino acid adenylation domain-containing protein
MHEGLEGIHAHLPPSPTAAVFDRSWLTQPVPEAFSQCARLNADRTALQLPQRSISYAELDDLAVRVARQVIRIEGQNTRAVAIVLGHDDPVPAAVLGVAQAGGFSVCIDPSYPVERNQFILDDIDAESVFTNLENREAAARVSRGSRSLSMLEDLADHAAVPREPLRRTDGADNLFQVLYTSGSTGWPKGVMRTHAGMLHNAMRHISSRQLGPSDRVGLLFSHSFAAAGSNVFAALLSGATLVPFRLRELGVTRLAEWLASERITHIHTVPTLFRRLAPELSRRGLLLPELKVIQLGGEPMFGDDLELFKRHFSEGCWLHVGMGATEVGHVLGCFLNHDSKVPAGVLPTGYPADGMRVWIEGKDGREAPPGTTGRIMISGPFVSPGYWNDPDGRSDRSRQDSDRPADPVHATGDLGRMGPDGLVTHISRDDGRVKIRGHRVETMEVESVLRRLPGVRDGAVIVRHSSGEAHLAAFVAFESEFSSDNTAIMGELRSLLPDYMIPSSVSVLDAMPELPNGKLDRNALHDLEPTATNVRDRQPPRYILEALLGAIWEELLGRDDFGVHDDFFDLGGNSLLAAEMVGRIEDSCGVRLDLPDFVTGLSIARACSALVAREESTLTGGPIVPLQTGGARAPLFFHCGDIETGGLYCRNLARHLGESQPFYMLSPHGLDGGPVPATIRAMALDRLGAVRAVQPLGPYRLGGFCYGGKVAYEMARILEDLGEGVEVVIMIDTRASGRDRTVRNEVAATSRDPVRGASRIGLTIAQLRIGQRQSYSFYRRARYAHHMMRRIGLRATVLRAGRMGRRVLRDGIRRTMSDEWSARDSEPRVLDDGSVYELSSVASRQWRPETFGGRVVLLHSSRIGPEDVDSEKASWSRSAQHFEMRSVPGDHRSCVTKYVAEVVREMRRALGAGPTEPKRHYDASAVEGA